MKDNTYCLAQRVKAAVMLQPSLIEGILNNKSTNFKIVESSFRRLLPYRTSVEIEFIGDQDLLKHKISKIFDIPTNISYDCGGPELRYSIRNCEDLINLYNILSILKRNAKVDTDGSIHIHVDIRKWLSDSNPKIKRLKYIGLLNITTFGYSNIVYACINEILNKSADIANLHIDQDTFNYSEGYDPVHNSSDIGNIRAISLFRNEKLYLEHLLREIMDKYNYNFKKIRKEKGIAYTYSKKTWINVRLAFGSIEIRTFPCSFDYETIIGFMISSNKLVKRILQIFEYLGNEAIKDNVLVLK